MDGIFSAITNVVRSVFSFLGGIIQRVVYAVQTTVSRYMSRRSAATYETTYP